MKRRKAFKESDCSKCVMSYTRDRKLYCVLHKKLRRNCKDFVPIDD